MNAKTNADRRTFLGALLAISSVLAACRHGGSDMRDQDGSLDDGGSSPSDGSRSGSGQEPAQPSKRTVYLATSFKDSVAAHGIWPARQHDSEIVYDEAGRVVHRVADTGFAGYVITADYVYDAGGYVAGASIDTGDAGGDGAAAPFDSTWTASWADDRSCVSWESDETPYGSFSVVCSYRADGKLADKDVRILGPQAGYEGSAQFVYDERGMLTAVHETPAYGAASTKEMAYDLSGRLISYVCEADSESCTYSYNRAGSLLEKRHTVGGYSSITSCSYDERGMLVSAQRTTSDPDNPEYGFKTRPQAACTFACDEHGNVVSGSRVVQADGLEDAYAVAYEVREIDPSDPMPYSAISLLDPTDPYPFLDEFYVIDEFCVFSRTRAEEDNARWLAEHAADADAADGEDAGAAD